MGTRRGEPRVRTLKVGPKTRSTCTVPCRRFGVSKYVLNSSPKFVPTNTTVVLIGHRLAVLSADALAHRF
jgi:hypothetical protein